jgi:hypothetical protein
MFLYQIVNEFRTPAPGHEACIAPIAWTRMASGKVDPK